MKGLQCDRSQSSRSLSTWLPRHRSKSPGHIHHFRQLGPARVGTQGLKQSAEAYKTDLDGAVRFPFDSNRWQGRSQNRPDDTCALRAAFERVAFVPPVGTSARSAGAQQTSKPFLTMGRANSRSRTYWLSRTVTICPVKFDICPARKSTTRSNGSNPNACPIGPRRLEFALTS